MNSGTASVPLFPRVMTAFTFTGTRPAAGARG
jgi:hypothetical protein